MDDNITLKNIKNEVQRFCEAREWDQFHNPKELAIGISTEATELLELFRFQSEEQMEQMLKDSQMRTKIGEELADTFFFVVRFAQMNQFDLQEILADKLEKNERRYSVEKSKGRNQKID